MVLRLILSDTFKDLIVHRLQGMLQLVPTILHEFVRILVRLVILALDTVLYVHFILFVLLLGAGRIDDISEGCDQGVCNADTVDICDLEIVHFYLLFL